MAVNKGQQINAVYNRTVGNLVIQHSGNNKQKRNAVYNRTVGKLAIQPYEVNNWFNKNCAITKNDINNKTKCEIIKLTQDYNIQPPCGLTKQKLCTYIHNEVVLIELKLSVKQVLNKSNNTYLIPNNRIKRIKEIQIIKKNVYPY